MQRQVIQSFTFGWLLLALGMLALPTPSVAQPTPVTFGSADDPRERLQPYWWRRDNSLEVMGGVSLIAAQWRGAGSLGFNLVTRAFTGRLSGTVRAGYYGEYGPDLDEPYDALRLVEFLRYSPPNGAPVYLRIGLLDRIRLGLGHVVNFYNSASAWDERTVGAEGAWTSSYVDIAAFTDNLLLDGVTGGRLAVRPMGWAERPALQSTTLGFNYVRDLAPVAEGTRPLEAFNIDTQFTLFNSGDIDFSPFATYAWYPEYGNGIGFGADLSSANFIDLLSFRLRVGLFYNSREFVPGYVGAFYTLSNPQARILNSDDDLNDEVGTFAQPFLGESGGGNDLLTEFQIQIGDNFEWWYSFRRHYSSQRLGNLNLRLFYRAIDKLQLEIGIDRSRLGSFFTIFNDMDDVSSLVFGLDYRIAGPFWVYFRSRYSYERVDPGNDHAQRYLVQRRFEPMTGFQLTF